MFLQNIISIRDELVIVYRKKVEMNMCKRTTLIQKIDEKEP